MTTPILNLNQVKTILQKHGTRGARLLSSLGQQHELVRALETDIGKTLLEDAVAKMDSLLLMIIDETADETHKAEYRVLRAITSRWAAKIDAYLKTISKIGGLNE